MIIEAALTSVFGGTIAGILDAAISGVVGNKTDKLVSDTFNQIIENFKKTDRLQNHDLQKAILRSYYFSLKSICEECLQKEKDNEQIISWLKNKEAEIQGIIKKVEKNECKFVPIEEIDKIKLLITTEGSISKEINTEKERLISYELVKDCPSRCYNELVKNTLYQRICGFFALEIKYNQIINNIFQSQLLTNIDIKVTQLLDFLSKDTMRYLPQIWESLGKIEHIMLENNKSFSAKLEEILAILQKIASGYITPPETTQCSFVFDESSYKLDDGFFSETEILSLESSFDNGYRIAAVRGIPGSGKSFIAKTFANRNRSKFPIVKFLRLTRSTEEQTLDELVLSDLDLLDEATKNKCFSVTKHEQFEIKRAAFNRVGVATKVLIIISGVNDITETDIEKLLQLKANFILCVNNRVLDSDKNVADIPVEDLLPENAISLFKSYYKSESDDDLLKIIIEKVWFHPGTIIFMAKLMKSHLIRVDQVKQLFDEAKINDYHLQIDAGTKMISLAQYHRVLFSFDKLNEKEASLLLLLSLLPNKSFNFYFLKNTFSEFDSNSVLSLSRKGYLDYDEETAQIRCSPFPTTTFYEMEEHPVKILESISDSVKGLLKYNDCKEFSEIEERISYGVYLSERLLFKNYKVDAELCVKIAQGYQLLCFFNEAQKYTDMASNYQTDKNVKTAIIHLKTEIMVFCFDYQSAVDLLESFITDTAWEQLSYKEQGELLYKLGLVYSFIDSGKCEMCFKKSFHAFQRAGLIVGEMGALTQLIIRAKSKKQIAHEINQYTEDSHKLLKTEPIWHFCGCSFRYFFKVISGKDNIFFNGIINDFGTINHGIFYDILFKVSFNKTIRAIRNKAKDGSKMENAFCSFMDESCQNSGSIKKATENLITFMYEFRNKIREIDIPIGSEITGLNQLMKFIPNELELIDEQTICKEIIKLFADRYSTLLATKSDKLLACISYANMLISVRDFEPAEAILKQQIAILEKYLPFENRYPLVVLYESLASCYFSAGNRANAKKYWQKALRVIEMIPHAFLKQSELLYKLDDYDSAIKLLEENNCLNCTLCNSYFYQARKKRNEPEEMGFFLRKMFYVQKHVAFCGTSCYAEKLYKLGKIFSNQKKPQIKYNLLAFFVDKSNKKATSDTASVNCSLLSDFFHNMHWHWLAEYFLKNSAKFAIKGRNTLGLKQVYQTYFLRANIEKETDSYKHELVKQHSIWLLEHFTNTAKFFYGKEIVSISDVSQLIFNEVDERVCRLTSEKKNSVNELLLISLSRNMNTSKWWYKPLKWKRIKSDLRWEFFYDLIFNFPEQVLNFKKECPFILIHNLTEKIESLLAEHNICGAEDLLFETMDKAHSYNFLPFCRHFYYRLGLFSDKCLRDANFSRDEIDDGLKQAERRFGQNSEHDISLYKTNHSKMIRSNLKI